MVSNAARELLLSLKGTANGVRYQAVDGQEKRKAAHELEDLGLAVWKGNSFGSNFYCITEDGIKELPK